MGTQARVPRLKYDSFYKQPPKRLLCWFSCGATSAVAAKLAMKAYPNLPVVIAYCDTGSEHESNYKFIDQCSKWYGKKIEVLKNPKFGNVWDVFEKTKYLAGIRGARCTTEMKKMVRRDFEDLTGDLQVFGFDGTELKRARNFIERNEEVRVYFPLIEQKVSKQNCIDLLKENDIEIPHMYKLGYKNNNCIGCVKGGAGYWNKIRDDFPDVFNRMSKLERKLNVAINKKYVDGKRIRVFLDELDPKAGRYESELEIMKCGLICGE